MVICDFGVLACFSISISISEHRIGQQNYEMVACIGGRSSIIAVFAGVVRLYPLRRGIGLARSHWSYILFRTAWQACKKLGVHSLELFWYPT